MEVCTLVRPRRRPSALRVPAFAREPIRAEEPREGSVHRPGRLGQPLLDGEEEPQPYDKQHGEESELGEQAQPPLGKHRG